jgi:hypothetical protein
LELLLQQAHGRAYAAGVNCATTAREAGGSNTCSSDW